MGEARPEFFRLTSLQPRSKIPTGDCRVLNDAGIDALVHQLPGNTLRVEPEDKRTRVPAPREMVRQVHGGRRRSSQFGWIRWGTQLVGAVGWPCGADEQCALGASELAAPEARYPTT